MSQIWDIRVKDFTSLLPFSEKIQNRLKIFAEPCRIVPSFGYYVQGHSKACGIAARLSTMGSVATLEDWFDARRLRDDYVPTGFSGGKARAVKGHTLGLELSPNDRQALIAFIKTL